MNKSQVAVIAALMSTVAYGFRSHVSAADSALPVSVPVPPAAEPSAERPLLTPPAPIGAGSTDNLSTCQWEESSSVTTAGAVALCNKTGSAQRVIGGGCVCSGNAELKYSVPFEATSLGGDPPEDGESWYNTTYQTGWRCEFNALCNPVRALAFCCGD